MRNILISGDPMAPTSGDTIAQFDLLPVGAPVPDGWRVLSGNERYSEIARVAYRYEIAAAPEIKEVLELVELALREGYSNCGEDPDCIFAEPLAATRRILLAL